VRDDKGSDITRGAAQEDIPAQRAHRIALLDWRRDPGRSYEVHLRLSQRDQILDENRYDDVFGIVPRPAGYPWRFDHLLGMRCYGGPHARSSLRVLNTWYGRLAALLFPVYDWAEHLLSGGTPSPRLQALLRWLLG
jgi:hypothetical protein